MFLHLRQNSAVALLAFWATMQVSLADTPPTFEAGEAAYIAGQFDEARAIYAAAAAAAATPKDRAASHRQLAIMAWRLDGDGTTAERHFASALAVGADVSRTHAERARYYAGAKRYDDAIAAGDAAVVAATSAEEQRRAALAYARTLCAQLDGVPVARQTPADERRLMRARDLIRAVGRTPPLPLELSEALLEIALRLDDGPLALTAWRSYAREGANEGAWASSARHLAQALPNWRRGKQTPALRAQVFDSLAASHFFELATMVAGDTRIEGHDTLGSSPRGSDVSAYAAFQSEVQSVTDAYYRAVAKRGADAGAWQASIFAAGRTLWSKIHFDDARPPFNPVGLQAELARRFGANINLGKTGGVLDLHYGHIFVDDARLIDQYGHKAQIRRIALDRMVSNGYESWVWDGRQAHGGWAENDRVYQVRPGYADGVLAQWDLLNDPKLRAEEEARIGRLTPLDDDIARKNPAAYLPGLAARLDWQGFNAILDGARRQGASGAKQRFIVDTLRIGLDANFFAHEGRHVLDKQAFGNSLDTEEMEFRGKLSEIAFSEQPRLSFGPIVSPNIDDPSSPHGRANKRIMQGLTAWMQKHRTSIANLDATRPLLPQLDKLSDDQMRDAMRAMDPWAPKR